MRAMALTEFGQPLQLHDLPMPVAGAGEVLVRVAKAALNPADLKVIRGGFDGRILHARRRPLVPGYDFAGVVEAVGAGATLEVGSPVFGHLAYASSNAQGSLGEYLTASVETIATREWVASEAGAGVATAGSTALQALRDLGHLQPGMRAWINGASGGVGSLAVQIAKCLGAEVWASCSASKATFVAGLGADRVIDYRTTPLPEGTFDVIFDAAAMLSFSKCSSRLAKRGTYVTTIPSGAFVAGKLLALFSSKSNRFVVVKSRRADLEQLAVWLAEGRLWVPIDSTFELEAANEGLARLASGEVRGKVVVAVGPD